MKVNNPIITSEIIKNYIQNRDLWRGNLRGKYFNILNGYGYSNSNLSTYNFISQLNQIQLNKLYNELKQLK